MEILKTPQASGTDQSIFGVNASLATSIVAAGIILAILATFITVAVAVMQPALDALAATSLANVGTALALQGAGLLLYCVPLAHIVNAIIAVTLFTIAIDVVSLVCAALVKACVD